MAMTMNADAFLVCGPSPFMPSAKMVGNMIDMKKKLAKSAPTEIAERRHHQAHDQHVHGREECERLFALNQLKARCQ